MQRKLSFIDCSIGQMRSGILAEDAQEKFNTNFWFAVLHDDPSDDFKPLQNRTLSFWVQVYNKWQEAGFPEYWNGTDLQDSIKIPEKKLLSIIKLFDEQGYRRLQSMGLTVSNLERVRVPVHPLFLAGVMLSKLISTKMKLRFTFGLVDWDDDRQLDLQQFSAWISSFIRGLGAAFDVDESIEPTDNSLKVICDRLYQRISTIAGRRIKELYANRSAEDTLLLKVELAKALKAKLAAQADMDAEPGEMPMSPMASLTRHSPAMACPHARQVLRYESLEEWCYRAYKDPLALPYALVIERFDATRSGLNASEADNHCEDLEGFYLSHMAPVAVPADTDVAAVSGMLTRSEVILCRSIFSYCMKQNTFDVMPWQLDEALGVEIQMNVWSKIEDAMNAIEKDWHQATGSKPNFFQFLRYACPGAREKHLRMFEVWCQEFDELAEAKERHRLIEEAGDVFEENDNLEIIPKSELDSLEKDFESLDTAGRGFLTADQLAQAWNMDLETVKGIIHKIDAEDRTLDKQDYFRLVCPSQYRLPEMSGDQRDLFGKLLESMENKSKAEVKRKAKMFGVGGSQSEGPDIAPTPLSLLPEVDEETWKFWNSVFTELDVTKDDALDLRDLKESGLLSEKVCEFIIDMLHSPDEGQCFTRQSFLNALLEATGCRRVGRLDCEVCPF